MRVRHPAAHPPAAVDVNGERVPVDGDTFELPDGAGRSWLQTFASAHDVDFEKILVGEGVDWHGTEPPFDPGDKTVDELDTHLEEQIDDLHDAEIEALVKAEKADKNRATALETIEDHFVDAVERHHSDEEE